jgi:hypothetical protein
MEIVASNHSLPDRQNIKRLGVDAPHTAAAEQEQKSPATVDENDGATDTSVDDFLYDVNGQYVSTRPYANMDYMDLVFSDYSIEQLKRDLNPVLAESIELVRGSIPTMPPEMLEGRGKPTSDLEASVIISSVSENIGRLDDMTRLLNAFIKSSQKPEHATNDNLRQGKEVWIDLLKSNIQNLARSLKSTTDVDGNLMKMNDDGTYSLSSFSIRYDGTTIAQHSE